MIPKSYANVVKAQTASSFPVDPFDLTQSLKVRIFEVRAVLKL